MMDFVVFVFLVEVEGENNGIAHFLGKKIESQQYITSTVFQYLWIL